MLLFKPGKEQTWADFEKLAFRGEVVYDPTGKPSVLGLCLHVIYMPVGSQRIKVGDLRPKMGQKGL